MVKEKFFKTVGRSPRAKGMFLNDDAIVFLDQEDLEDFTSIDLEICEALGLIPKDEKSFVCYACGVFCENYLFNTEFS